VRRRYAPFLSTFDDAELRGGIDELRERLAPLDRIELPHRFDRVDTG
jgi:hypothetical protein